MHSEKEGKMTLHIEGREAMRTLDDHELGAATGGMSETGWAGGPTIQTGTTDFNGGSAAVRGGETTSGGQARENGPSLY
jgi:hypothetical protein